MSDTKLAMLERTVMDLGAELFNLKGIVAKSQESHEQMVALVKSLKSLLDDKGVITGDDFDAAVDLSAAIEACDVQRDMLRPDDSLRKKASGH